MVLATFLLVAQVLALGTKHFHEQVNSDDLYPYVFSQDVLHGTWPVSGWTLSSAPYLFPDFTLLTLLIGVTGWQGSSIPAYAVLSALMLALAAGWLIDALDPRPRKRGILANARSAQSESSEFAELPETAESLEFAEAPKSDKSVESIDSVKPAFAQSFRDAPWLRGFLAVNALVALGFLPHLDRWVWWQFAPGFHGGAVILAVAIAALAATEMNRGPSWARTAGLAWLLWFGVWSDSFVIVEAVVPLGAALVWATWDRADFVGPVRRFLVANMAAFGLLLVSKMWLAWSEIFFAGRVFRYTPTPTLFAKTAIAWWHDLWGERVVMTIWILLGLGLLLWIWWRTEKQARVANSTMPLQRSTPSGWPRPISGFRTSDLERIRFLGTWTLLSVVLVLGALWFMGYWHDISNARYLVPLQTFPVIALAAWVRWPQIVRRAAAKRLAGTGLGFVLLGLSAWAFANTRRNSLIYPYPNDVAVLDDFCRERHFTRGLGDYWTLHYFNVLSREGVRMSALRAAANSTYPASTASFWNNNVYGFLDRDLRTGQWHLPTYEFIVVNRLDESSLRARYGEPREVVEIGPWKIWIPVSPSAVSSLVVSDVRARLRGRRWDAVAEDLGKDLAKTPTQ